MTYVRQKPRRDAYIASQTPLKFFKVVFNTLIVCACLGIAGLVDIKIVCCCLGHGGIGILCDSDEIVLEHQTKIMILTQNENDC